jgi:hypothetical protein
MKKRFNTFVAGLITGLVCPPLAFAAFSRISFPEIEVYDQLNSYYHRNVLPHVISLSVIVNLALFFLLLKFNHDHAARGILGATFIFAFLVLILKFT